MRKLIAGQDRVKMEAGDVIDSYALDMLDYRIEDAYYVRKYEALIPMVLPNYNDVINLNMDRLYTIATIKDSPSIRRLMCTHEVEHPLIHTIIYMFNNTTEENVKRAINPVYNEMLLGYSVPALGYPVPAWFFLDSKDIQSLRYRMDMVENFKKMRS